MLVGYARVSTQDQDPALQLDALKGAGCEKIFTEKASGAQRDRPQLRAALGYMRSGDTLVVWKLDRLARSLKQLIETVEDLGDQGPCSANGPSSGNGGGIGSPGRERQSWFASAGEAIAAGLKARRGERRGYRRPR